MKYCHRDHLFLERTIKRASQALHLLFLDLHNVENNILEARRKALLILNTKKKKKIKVGSGGRYKKWEKVEWKRNVCFIVTNFSGKLLCSHQFGKRYFASHAEFRCA